MSERISVDPNVEGAAILHNFIIAFVRVGRLLEDAQPGLATWNMMLGGELVKLKAELNALGIPDQERPEEDDHDDRHPKRLPPGRPTR